MPVGRPKTHVLDRIQNQVNINFLPYIGSTFPEDIKDAHWVWTGRITPPKFVIEIIRGRRSIREHRQTPIRIREAGRLRSVSRILFETIFGDEFPTDARRTHGCNFQCVNPFHIPRANQSVVVPQTGSDEEIIELAAAIADHIGIHGNDRDAIKDKFLLDYSEDEIIRALELL